MEAERPLGLSAASHASALRLPCGHDAPLPAEGSMMALSASVLDHLSGCPSTGTLLLPLGRPYDRSGAREVIQTAHPEAMHYRSRGEP